MHEGHRKRLLDKIVSGKQMLSDHEILEAILFYAVPRKNMNGVAHRLIDAFGSLSGVLSADEQSLRSVEGVGEQTAAYIVCLGEISARSKNEKNQLPTLFSFDNCKPYLVNSFRGLSGEMFLALFLNKNGELMMRKIFNSHSRRTVDFSLEDFNSGLASCKPHSVIIAHNHLSGNVTPSLSDDVATEKLSYLLRLNNIAFFDHIIVSGEEAFSYRLSGKLEGIMRNAEIALFSIQSPRT